ncbi:septum formation family protein [Leifsonia sp. H3M29-4]|uniref:septum formation family protein n=1 Tax=Salinibacterium metalliresistens TaxID=3031321 RepID=UPI0023DA1F64|nr:septum formation family protein [Salinibacterium metalliresistens]MDF1479644.1 septum formation family protein [Salinibacterium metalliresistens]
MTASEPTQTVTADAERGPRWARIGLIAAAAVVVAIIATVGFRAVLANPTPALGATAAADLKLGSCLAEDGVDLATWTVVDCQIEHPQQVVASMDLSVVTNVYSAFSAMTTMAEEICDRYLEYGLFVEDSVDAKTHDLVGIAVPSQEQYEAGDTIALCAVVALDGSALTGDLYRPMP